MIREVHSALPGWTIRVAAIYALPSQRRRRQRGRKSQKGKRLPAPKQLAARRKKGWQTVQVLIYGKRVKRRVLPIICLWYHVSKDRPIKLLIIRYPAGKQNDDFAFCTDPTVDDGQIVERFAARWPIEESIHDGKQLGGFEQVQGWCPRTVERQAPMALVVQTLVKAWYLHYGARAKSAQPKGTDWMPDKDHPSYLDMLATLRRALWAHRININSILKGRVRELWNTLQYTLCAAA